MDLSNLHQPAQKRPNGDVYYEVEYEIVLMFGLTEFKAQVVWKENVRFNSMQYECETDPRLEFTGSWEKVHRCESLHNIP